MEAKVSRIEIQRQHKSCVACGFHLHLFARENRMVALESKTYVWCIGSNYHTHIIHMLVTRFRFEWKNVGASRKQIFGAE